MNEEQSRAGSAGRDGILGILGILGIKSSVSSLVEMQHLLGEGISVAGKVHRERMYLIKGLDVSFLLTKENWPEKTLAA